MSLVKQFLIALYRFGSYPELIKVKGIRVFIYGAITVILATLIMTAALIPAYNAIGGMEGFAQKYTPDFVLKDGELTMDKVDYTDKLNGVRIYIDTNSNELNLSAAGDSIIAFIADKKEMYFFNGIQGWHISFNALPMDISSDEIKTDLSNPAIRFGVISIFVSMLFCGNLGRTISSTLMLVIIGNMINMFVTRIPLRFTQMLRLAVYARTLPFIMQIFIQILFGFNFEPLVFYAIGGTYIYLGLKNIKMQNGIVIADVSGYNTGNKS